MRYKSAIERNKAFKKQAGENTIRIYIEKKEKKRGNEEEKINNDFLLGKKKCEKILHSK